MGSSHHQVSRLNTLVELTDLVAFQIPKTGMELEEQVFLAMVMFQHYQMVHISKQNHS